MPENFSSAISFDLSASAMQLIEGLFQGNGYPVIQFCKTYGHKPLPITSNRIVVNKTLNESVQQFFRQIHMENLPVNNITTHLQSSEIGVEYHVTNSLKTFRIFNGFGVLSIERFSCLNDLWHL